MKAMSTGGRERKKRETRERITRAARTLFRRHGFDATTVDAISAEAGISRRSFFHYFPAKESIIIAWQDELEIALADALAVQPATWSLLRVAERAVVAAAGHFDHGDAVTLSRIVHESAVLRARNQARYERLELTLAAKLAERIGAAADDLRARLVAMVAIGALRVAADAWLENGGPNERPADYVRRVFRKLRRELAVR
jgi:AcrR family transcriptional regulator